MFCKLLWRIFWRTLRLSYPWLPLTIYFWRMVTASPVQKSRAQLKFWTLYSRIDFAELHATAIDMIQPQYWLL